MKIKIIEKEKNKLLDRLEVKFEVESPGETPKRLDIKAKLAALINYDEKLVIIKGLHQETGIRRSQGIAHAYEKEENLKRVEPAYIIKRNSPEAQKSSNET